MTATTTSQMKNNDLGSKNHQTKDNAGLYVAIGVDVSRVVTERNNCPIIISNDTTASAVISVLKKQLKNTAGNKTSLQLCGDVQDGKSIKKTVRFTDEDRPLNIYRQAAKGSFRFYLDYSANNINSFSPILSNDLKVKQQQQFEKKTTASAAAAAVAAAGDSNSSKSIVNSSDSLSTKANGSTFFGCTLPGHGEPNEISGQSATATASRPSLGAEDCLVCYDKHSNSLLSRLEKRSYENIAIDVEKDMPEVAGSNSHKSRAKLSLEDSGIEVNNNTFGEARMQIGKSTESQASKLLASNSTLGRVAPSTETVSSRAFNGSGTNGIQSDGRLKEKQKQPSTMLTDPKQQQQQQRRRSSSQIQSSVGDNANGTRRALPAVSLTREELEKKRLSLTENINEKLKEMCLDTRSILRDRLRAKYGLPQEKITAAQPLPAQPAQQLQLQELRNAEVAHLNFVKEKNAQNSSRSGRGEALNEDVDDDDGRSVTSMEVATIMSHEPILSDSEYGSSPPLDDVNGNYCDDDDSDNDVNSFIIDEDGSQRTSITSSTAQRSVQSQNNMKQQSGGLITEGGARKTTASSPGKALSTFAEQSMANFLGFVSPSSGRSSGFDNQATGGRLHRAPKTENLYHSSLDNAVLTNDAPDKNNNSKHQNDKHKLTMFTLLRTHTLLPLTIRRIVNTDAIELTDLNMYVDGKLQGQVVAISDFDRQTLIISGGRLDISDIIVEVNKCNTLQMTASRVTSLMTLTDSLEVVVARLRQLTHRAQQTSSDSYPSAISGRQQSNNSSIQSVLI